MLTSASSESSALALTLNLNESSPLKSAAGVYFTVSVQVLGAVLVQLTALKFESVPWLGFWVMVKVSTKFCEYVPVIVIELMATSSLVEGCGLGGTDVGIQPPPVCVSNAPMSEPSPPTAFG